MLLLLIGYFVQMKTNYLAFSSILFFLMEYAHPMNTSFFNGIHSPYKHIRKTGSISVSLSTVMSPTTEKIISHYPCQVQNLNPDGLVPLQEIQPVELYSFRLFLFFEIQTLFVAGTMELLVCSLAIIEVYEFHIWHSFGSKNFQSFGIFLA